MNVEAHCRSCGEAGCIPAAGQRHRWSESRPRKLRGGGIICFGEEGRDVLGRTLILEPVHIIFLREPVRRPGFVSQQVPDRVVVLAMRKAAYGQFVVFSGRTVNTYQTQRESPAVRIS